MSPRNEKLSSPIQSLLEKYALQQRHQPTLVHRSISRRNFLRATAIGGVALTMSPVERAIAAYCAPSAVDPMGLTLPGGILDDVLGLGRILAHLLGFGMLFETAYGILGHFFPDRFSQNNARGGVDDAMSEIRDKMTNYIGLNLSDIRKRLKDQNGSPVRTTFASGNRTSSLLQRPRGLSLAHAATPPDNKQFYAMALSRTTMNSLIPFFDYNGARPQNEARALVGVPTLQTFNRLFGIPFLNSYGERLSSFLYPKSQPNNYRAYRVWEQSYGVQDRFETSQGTTPEFNWEYKGPFTVNDAASGTVYGLLTTNLGGFPKEKGKESLELIETYCWIPPITKLPTPCTG